LQSDKHVQRSGRGPRGWLSWHEKTNKIKVIEVKVSSAYGGPLSASAGSDHGPPPSGGTLALPLPPPGLSLHEKLDKLNEVAEKLDGITEKLDMIADKLDTTLDKVTERPPPPPPSPTPPPPLPPPPSPSS